MMFYYREAALDLMHQGFPRVPTFALFLTYLVWKVEQPLEFSRITALTCCDLVGAALRTHFYNLTFCKAALKPPGPHLYNLPFARPPSSPRALTPTTYFLQGLPSSPRPSPLQLTFCKACLIAPRPHLCNLLLAPPSRPYSQQTSTSACTCPHRPTRNDPRLARAACGSLASYANSHFRRL